jgi:hypothetical protein
MKTSKIAILAATLSLAGSAALAGPIGLPFLPPPPPKNPPPWSPPSHCDSRSCMSAPEIDPGSAMGGLALLAGTVAIVRGRRGKK